MGMRYLPKAYQKPNIVADQLASLLTDGEYKVLDIIIRCILGYSDKIDDLHAPIRVSFLVERTGKCKSAVLKCLRGLTDANVVIPIAKGQGRHNGTEWSLNLGQHGEYDWDWLRKRKEIAKDRARKRTEAARESTQGGNSPTEPVDNSPEIVDNSGAIVDNSPQNGGEPGEMVHTSTTPRKQESLSDRPEKVCGTDPPPLETQLPNPTSTGPPVTCKQFFKKTGSQHVYRLALDFAQQWEADTPAALAHCVVQSFEECPMAVDAFRKALYRLRGEVIRAATKENRPGMFLTRVRKLAADCRR